MRWRLVGMAVGAVLLACGSESKTQDGGDSTGGVAGSVATGGSGAASGAGSGGTAGGGASSGGTAGSAATGGSGAASGAGSGGTAGSRAGSGGNSGGGDGGACNQIEANAPRHPYLFDPGQAPMAMGGTILDGTYFVTSETQYESPPSPTIDRRGARIDIAGNVWQEADGPEPELTPTRRYTYAVSVDSPLLTQTQTCPTAAGTQVFSYTVEETGLTIYIPVGDVVLGVTLARQ